MQRRHPQNPGRFTQVRRTAPSGYAAPLAAHARRACSLGIACAPLKAISHRECVRSEPLEFYPGKAFSCREPHTPTVKVRWGVVSPKSILTHLAKGGAALPCYRRDFVNPMPEGRGIRAASYR